MAIAPAVTLPPAPLRLHIDSAALADNWRALARLSGNAQTGAAVKADAYGLGIDRVVPALRDAGAQDFFVAHWAEVPGVLRHVAAAQLRVLHGITTPQEAAFAREAGVLPVLNSLHQVHNWLEAGGGPCDLMVDTGINRLGVPSALLGDPLIAGLHVDTLHSHLACADEDVSGNGRQLAAFRAAVAQIPHRRASLANSAGIALGADYAFDLTRPGLALYGGVARAELGSVVRQVAYPSAVVLQRRRIEGGEAVGYNAQFVATGSMEVATISIGYADGFLRCRGVNAALQHDGRSLPVIGRVSMDMVVVDCSQLPALSEGDFVEIPFDLTVEAQRCGLSQYELLTTLGKRFDHTA